MKNLAEGVFDGNVYNRERIEMNFESYLQGFVNRKEGQSHWIEELKLNLYLSQCSIYSNDPESPAQLPQIYSLFSIPEVMKGDDSMKNK